MQVRYFILVVFGSRYATVGYPSNCWALVSSDYRELWPMT